MSESIFGAGVRSADRGVNNIEDNRVGSDSRQFITCPSRDLMTARKNTAADKSLRCLCPMDRDVTHQISHDFSRGGKASIDVRQSGSGTAFQGEGRTVHCVEGANANE